MDKKIVPIFGKITKIDVLTKKTSRPNFKVQNIHITTLKPKNESADLIDNGQNFFRKVRPKMSSSFLQID